VPADLPADQPADQPAAATLASPSPVDPTDARGWCVLAQTGIAAARNDDAVRAAARAIALRPDWEWPHRLASIALGQLGRHRDALVAARESARLAPTQWRCLVTLAQAAARAGEFAIAADAAARAVELAPTVAQAHAALGWAPSAGAGRAERPRRATTLDR
jgi:cytochrome c-type biogenesis protein CcmH/NrfG